MKVEKEDNVLTNSKVASENVCNRGHKHTFSAARARASASIFSCTARLAVSARTWAESTVAPNTPRGGGRGWGQEVKLSHS